MMYGSRPHGLISLAMLSAVACGDAPVERAFQGEGLLAAAREGPECQGGAEVQGSPAAPQARDAGRTTCSVPKDCDPVPLTFFDLDACCTETVACGFDVSDVPAALQTLPDAIGLAEGETCAPRERFFLRHPGSEDLRVPTEEGDEILLSTGCDTASILSISFIGCCMPSGRCGVSTYGIWDTLAVFSPGEPFSRLQCVSSKELNAQLAGSKLKGLRFLPDTDAPCDYAALDAQLPPVEPEWR